MRDAQPKAIQLKDYEVPEFLIDSTELDFQLDSEATTVTSRLHMRRNPQSTAPLDKPLCLNGQQLQLMSVKIDGVPVSADNYLQSPEHLQLAAPAKPFVFECVTRIKPQENTSLEGLYKSRTMYCTQCEAEGFRKITYYLDRPDVMSVFTVTMTADKAQFPVLLSNGNDVARGELNDGRHWVRWHDPFKKPAYLFALVAGDLQYIEDHFTTLSGRDVTLRIFVEAKDIDKCEHAMRSLINSMKWDEDVYGREYDLDIFNVVAVDDFNMGAMENKSLNIFNTSCVLANPDTTTDAGFQRVESVVAHEYFHNWSGNRVTCRDWFQLSLKEGFTVFRDAEFSSDMGSRTVKRVEDAMLMRTVQFAEDAGPMAHPVRPESYIEISNFYTVTVYEKGAEVVRMLHQLLGAKIFRRGTDLYFSRHDGQAVTCEDFVRAMEEASGRDLQQFRRWYSQAGTPQLQVSGHHDAQAGTYTLTVRQSCPATPGQPHKEPFHIPLAVGLLGRDGMLTLEGGQQETVLDVTQAEQSFVFKNVGEQPVPSLLRDFSAPVRLSYPYSRDELMALMRGDSDGFSRWDAAQSLGVQVLRDMMAAIQRGDEPLIDDRLTEAFRTLLSDHSLDKAMVALMLRLPSEAYLAELAEEVDVHAIYTARTSARLQLAAALEKELWAAFRDNDSTAPYEASAAQIAQRSLKNTALSYLMLLETDEVRRVCVEQFDAARNMTDVMAALTALVNSGFGEDKGRVLRDFYQRWQQEALVINQWFMVQATCATPGTLAHVQQLMTHPAFDIRNPNKVRAVVGAFCAQNAVNFHQKDGEGYRFLADQVLVLDKLNPQVASRLLNPLSKWRKYPALSQQRMREQLQRIAAEPTLSKDVYEVVSKSLA